ncbi:hypothetical protein [Caloramator fervidus]|nr:hypothetical protein [Caloramator fervidus]
MRLSKKMVGKRFKFNYNLEKYGEFIPSFNSWMTPEEQRKRVEKINKDLEG